MLEDVGIADDVIPVTYMNSSADIKAFVGRHGGTVCTSSNARRALEWALSRGSKVLFLPDQHLGRNTAVLEMGMDLADCVVYDPHKPDGGLDPKRLRAATSDSVAWPLLGARKVQQGQPSTRSARGFPAST